MCRNAILLPSAGKWQMEGSYRTLRMLNACGLPTWRTWWADWEAGLPRNSLGYDMGEIVLNSSCGKHRIV